MFFFCWDWFSDLPTARRDGFTWVWRIDIPGTIIAGSVFERKSGGGSLFEPRPDAVWAANAAAAALKIKYKTKQK